MKQNIAELQKYYSHLSDSQIKRIKNRELNNLTPEAQYVLQEEIQKREKQLIISITKTINNVEINLRQNKVWRAKEILQGAIGTFGYQVHLYEKYGTVLLEMKDLLEAGRFLFLSVSRKPEYQEAINLYINKFNKSDHLHIYRSFPNKAQLSTVSDYPSALQEELRKLGFPEQIGHTTKQINSATSRKFKLRNVGFIILALAAIYILILGFIKFYEILIRIIDNF